MQFSIFTLLHYSLVIIDKSTIDPHSTSTYIHQPVFTPTFQCVFYLVLDVTQHSTVPCHCDIQLYVTKINIHNFK